MQPPDAGPGLLGEGAGRPEGSDGTSEVLAWVTGSSRGDWALRAVLRSWYGVPGAVGREGAPGDVATGLPIALLKPLQDRVNELDRECGALRRPVKDLSAEVEHQRVVINETTSKLETANKRADLATQRADYYQNAFDQRAGN